MEFLRKRVELKMKLQKHSNISGDTYTIVPDTSVSYGFKISLTAEGKDLGFFDAITDTIISGYYGYYGYYGQNSAPITNNYPIGLENLL